MTRPNGLGRGRFLLLEGVVVLLSILAAFALEAWWDGRQHATDLRLELSNVLSEVQAKRADVLQQAKQLERVVDGATDLLQVMDANPTVGSVFVADTVIYLSSVLPTLNPRLSALDGLVTSGLLASIDDPGLRSALGALAGDVEDAVTEIERVRAVFFSVHQPELARAGFDNAPLVRLVELDRQLAEGTPLPSAGLIEFPNPITLRNQIRVRRVVVQGAISNFASLEGQLAEIAAWIERYLAD